MNASTCTFVTAFFQIYKENANSDQQKAALKKRFQHFSYLASTGIPIVLFTDDSGLAIAQRIKQMSNPLLHIIHCQFEELETYQETMSIGDLDLPPSRSEQKDTKEFMILMHAKAELVYKAMEINPFHTNHFAWIDFSITYILKNMDKTLLEIKSLAQRKYQEKPFLAIPGCWSRGIGLSYLWDSIHWRFCGGFFIGDQQSLSDFYHLYRREYKRILQEKKRMIWETNLWSLLEADHNWSPNWFKADHNDSMLFLPKEF